MQPDPQMLTTLAFVVLAALVGGFAARLLRLPIVLGYILAGVGVSAVGEGLGISASSTVAIAEFGVALLLFAVGVEFSLKDLRGAALLASVGAPVQIVACIALGYGLGIALGFEPLPSIILGYAISMSSTAVALKLLEAKSEIGSAYGIAALSFALVQDLSLVLGLALLPLAVTGADAPTAAEKIALSGAILAVSLLFATRVLPWLLKVVALLRSRELFILLVVGVCFGAAYGAHLLGLSMAVGAFLAGLMISESEYSHEVLAEVIPFRELFGSVFFVSMGMLLDLNFVAGHWVAILALSGLILVGKALIIGGLARLLGWHLRVALAAGLALSQIGEFSFVLANVGLDLRLLPREMYDLLISSAAVTILLSPLLFTAFDPLSIYLATRLEDWKADKRVEVPAGLRNHVILGGCGRVGSHVLTLLDGCGIKTIVIDFDHHALREARGANVLTVFGDAGNVEILRRCRPEYARIAVLTMPDRPACLLATRVLRRLNPDLPVIVRSHSAEAARELEKSGARAAVLAEEETAKSLARRALDACGMNPVEADARISASSRAWQHKGF